MKALVVYYSRTQTTKKLASVIAKQLNSDLDEIIDTKRRSGAWGYIVAGWDAMRRRFSLIKFNSNASKYDLVVVGTPVWGWNIVPAVRTYLAQNADSIRKVAFFCTMGGKNPGKTFADMQLVSEKKPKAVLAMRQVDVQAGRFEQVKGFVAKLRK